MTTYLSSSGSFSTVQPAITDLNAGTGILNYSVNLTSATTLAVQNTFVSILTASATTTGTWLYSVTINGFDTGAAVAISAKIVDAGLPTSGIGGISFVTPAAGSSQGTSFLGFITSTSTNIILKVATSGTGTSLQSTAGILGSPQTSTHMHILRIA